MIKKVARKGTAVINEASIKRAVQRKLTAEKKAQSAGTTPSTYVKQKTGRREVEVEIVDISPDFAAELLKLIPEKQRKLRASLVDRYAADMLAGRWRKTGDPIRLSTDMLLLDGQHRCAGAVKAGYTLEDQLLVTLHDPRAFEALDQQAPRSLKDIVHMSGGVKAAPTVYSAIIYEYLDFKPRRLSKPEQLGIINAFPQKDLDVIKQFDATRVTTAGMLAAAIRCMRVDRADAVKFYTAVFHNKPIIDDVFEENAHGLANWIMQNKREKRIGKSAEGYKRECAYRCIQRWNHWRKGTVLRKNNYNPTLPMIEAL